MKKAIRATLWILTIFFALSALVYFPSFFSIFAIFIVALIIPIQRWRKFLNKYIKSWIRSTIVIALAVICIITVPSTNTSSDANSPANTPTKTETINPVDEPDTQTSHIHSFSAATCTVPKTCTDCGITEGSTTEHKWEAATCLEPKTCTVCAATEGTFAEHKWKDATYSAPKKCTVCGATEGNAVEIPEIGNYHGHVYTGGDKSTKYHYEAECAGKYSHEITWEDVDRQNLGPCGTCVLK